VHRHGLIEVIDFEHDGVPIGLERPKVVLFVRVVGVAKSSNTAMVLTIRLTASGPRAATPGVMTAMPAAKFWRNSSFSARMLALGGLV
jgi:hypothetical protein